MASILQSFTNTEQLQEATISHDGSQKIYSFAGEAFKCDDFYSKNQIYKNIPKNLWWIIIVGLILAMVFTVVLNSYWPILL
jgi:hypothetical protein